MKKTIRLTESDLVYLVKRVIKESEVEESAFTFGDKVRGKLGKFALGIPERTDDEKRLAEDILAKVESGEYEVLETYNSFIVPKGFKIKVPLNDGDYFVDIKKQKINLEAHITNTMVTTPDDEEVIIPGSGFANKLINLIIKQDRGERFRYPKK
jgi:hypothetical protein